MSQVIGSAAAVQEIIPYAPAGDFRTEAVAASQAMLQQPGVPSDLANAGLSLCVPAVDEGSSGAMYRLRRQATALAAGGLTAGGLALALAGWAGLWGMPELVLVSLGLALLGLLAQLLDIYWRNATTRSTLRARLGGGGVEDSSAHPLGAFCVNLENGNNFLRPKAIGEDVGLLYCDPQHRCLRIEGLTHRYFIRAADVVRVRVRRAPGVCATEVRYRVDQVELAIVLTHYPLNPLEFCLVLLSIRSRLHRCIVAAIGCGGAAARTTPVAISSDPQ